MNTDKVIHLGLLSILILTSCRSGAGEIDLERASSTASAGTIAPAGPTQTPTMTSTPAPTFTPTNTPVVILDPGPIQIDFLTDDGIWLSGNYYPAEINPAPLIVLFHWARGDQAEWEEIAVWLQDRGQLDSKPDYNRSWKSSVWFPEQTLENSIGILTVNFRECAGGCKAYLPTEWLLDVEAVMFASSSLQGVDPNAILTAGASIGADGAIYGCSWLNKQDQGTCRGSFLLSPGSTLTIPFDLLAAELSLDRSLPIYCLIGLRDDASVETCFDIPGLTLVDYGYIENHGFELVQPEIGRNPLLLLQEFIGSALSGE